MASLTIRNLSEDTKTKLKEQAQASGRSLEAYVKGLLDRATEQSTLRHQAAFPYDLMELVAPGDDIDVFIAQQDRAQPVVDL
ncbi:hypothetical protein [uncultured Thiodictyon sp.]|uniref:FitA-like ribbon-helix-helix domain-containing protein n=1 Tax=uncultured Thiodictyon sp. TaxID=1846217 RepID=UPI0025FC2AC5|nr:hypothetical protein [uncultured Thiodictyon sp.]